MKSTDDNMEKRIQECAEELFINKGYNLTSTTEIAKAAGCTQALIHYYFRTKENLFQKIFSEKINLIIETIAVEEDESLPFPEMLDVRISRLFNFLSENPRLPFMIFNEFIINQNQRYALKEVIMTSCINSTKRLEEDIEKQIKMGKIRKTTATDLTLNIFSLVVSFFIYLPFLEDMGIVTEENKDEFIRHRKEDIINTITRSL